MTGYNLFFTYLLLGSVFCYGQNASISGFLQNEKGEGIHGAYIKLNDQKATATNEEGRFEFKNLKPGDYIIKAFFMGFKAIRGKIHLDKGQRLIIDFTLDEEVTQPKEIAETGQSEVKGLKERIASLSLVHVKSFYNKSIYTVDLLNTVSGVQVHQNSGVGNSMEVSIILEKVISGARAATLFGTLTSSIMVKDENGDIYTQGSRLFSDKASGILRISSGQTEFDGDYFFNLSTAVGGSCFGLYHFRNGATFTAVSEDDDNWFGFDGNNPTFRYRKINLTARTDGEDLGASLHNMFPASRTLLFIQTSTDEVLFPRLEKMTMHSTATQSVRVRYLRRSPVAAATWVG